MSLINRLKEIQSQLQLVGTEKYLFYLFEEVAGIWEQRPQWKVM